MTHIPFFNDNYPNTQSKYRIAPGRSISAIAAFNDDGNIKPLRIRLKTSEGCIDANVDKVISSKEVTSMYHIFECIVSTDDGIQSQVRLYYDSPTNKWTLGERRSE